MIEGALGSQPDERTEKRHHRYALLDDVASLPRAPVPQINVACGAIDAGRVESNASNAIQIDKRYLLHAHLLTTERQGCYSN